jgi:hypothetical protein
MATSIATLQTIWDCRWSRLGRQVHGVEGREQPEPFWVCVRHPGKRRGVIDQECEECGFWEKEDPHAGGSNDA